MNKHLLISALGLTQIMAWGSTYYLSAVLAAPIAADTGWPQTWIVGALSIGLLMAGLVSPRVGRVIGATGGRRVLALSAVSIACGQIILGLAQTLPVYAGGWVVIGIGMGMGLYDAAFATLGRIFGASARSAITILTLWGGFASTVCWPLSAWLVSTLGWRDTCFVYAAIQLGFSLPLLLAVLPREAPALSKSVGGRADSGSLSAVERRAFGILAVILVVTGVTTTILSVHLLGLLQSRGLSLPEVVALGTLIGPSQVGGRLVEMAGRGRHHPLGSLSASVLLLALGLVLLRSELVGPAIALVIYGAGNGVFSIARGTLPLALFGAARYAPLMGRLARPALFAQSAAPFVGALVIDHLGAAVALTCLCLSTLLNIALVAVLWVARRKLEA